MSREVCGTCWCPYDEDTGECACPPPSVQKSTLRGAATKALEALVAAYQGKDKTGQVTEAITALKVALAEPVQEPIPLNDGRLWQYPDGSLGVGTPAEPLVQEPTVPSDCPDSHQPVAWMYTGIKHDGTPHGPHLVWMPKYMDAMSADKGAKAMPLYTAPPQRKPLSGLDVERLLEQVIGSLPVARRLIRAVERAHGIGGQDD